MSREDEPVIVYTTWPDGDTAAATARHLVTERLAACANILAATTSTYEWDGDVQCDTERPMLIKTVRGRVAAVMEAVKMSHPYDVPAITVIALEQSDAAFLEWLRVQTLPVKNTKVNNDE